MAATNEHSILYPEFYTDVNILIAELKDRLTNPYKYQYKIGEIFSGKAIGKAGMPRSPQTTQEWANTQSCSRVMSIIENIQKQIKSTEMNYVLKNLLESLFTELESDACKRLPRLNNLFQKTEISRLFSYIRSTNAFVNNSLISVVRDQKIRHLCYLFGRCYTDRLEQYMQLCLHGESDVNKLLINGIYLPSLHYNYMYNYSSIPHFPLQIIPRDQRKFEKASVAQIVKDIVERPYGTIPKDELSSLFDLTRGDKYKLLKDETTANLDLFHALMNDVQTISLKVYAVMYITYSVIIEQDIQYLQGYDRPAFQFFENIIQQENINYYIQLYNYIIQSKLLRTSSTELGISIKLSLEEFKFLSNMYGVSISNEDSSIGYYNSVIMTALSGIFGGNTPSPHKGDPMFKLIIQIIYDLCIRTDSFFSLYLLTAILKYVDLQELSDTDLRKNILDFVFEKQVKFNQKILINNPFFLQNIPDEHQGFIFLLTKGSPFQTVLSMAMNMMIETPPGALHMACIPKTLQMIQSDIEETRNRLTERGYEYNYTKELKERNGVFKTLVQKHFLLFCDVFTVYSILEAMMINLQERLENPLKVSLFSKDCLLKGPVGVAGVPRSCASSQEYKRLGECRKSLQESLQNLVVSMGKMNYRHVRITIENIQPFMENIQAFLTIFQNSIRCQEFDRLQTFAQNKSTGYEGDISFLNQFVKSIQYFTVDNINNVVDSLLLVDDATIGGRRKRTKTLHKRHVHKKTRRQKTRKQKAQRSTKSNARR